MTAFCIGNGESRAGVDLEPLKQHGELYGSNGIHRDMVVHHLVCCDRRMVDEVLASGYTGPVYTRDRWVNGYPGVRTLPEFSWPQDVKWQQSFHWGSGLHAVHLAITHGAADLRMIGHDLYGIGNKHNNLYKGTKNYESADYRAVGHSFWVLQFKLLAEVFPDVSFTFYQPNGWSVPVEWKNQPNFYYRQLTDLF